MPDTNEYSLLESIIAKLPGHIYWKNTQGVYLGCNDAQAEFLGLKSRKEIIGKSDFDLPWKDQANKLREADLQVINNAESITTEESVVLPGGICATFLSKKHPLRDKNNHIIGILGVSIDITEIKNFQNELKKSNRAKSEFLRIISHEVKNPVSNILSLLDIIYKKVHGEFFDKDSVLNNLMTARQEAEKINPKIDNVINYINFDKENISSHKENCDVLKLTREIVKRLAYLNGQKNLFVEVKSIGDFPERIHIDVQNLYLVISIIVENAIKFTPKGNIDIAFRTVNISGKNLISLTVEDTGVGIYEEQLKFIFYGFDEALNDFDFSVYRKPSIRLPYANLIVQEILKGEIFIESMIGKGTKVTISIPYEDSNFEEYQQYSVPKVLLIEDDPITLQLEKELLGILKCSVKLASTGREALDKASKEKFDFIFLDISLPDMNGIQFFTELRKTLSAETPTVALTSHSREEDLDLFTSKGILATIPKPVKLEDFEGFFDSFKQSDWK